MGTHNRGELSDIDLGGVKPRKDLGFQLLSLARSIGVEDGDMETPLFRRLRYSPDHYLDRSFPTPHLSVEPGLAVIKMKDGLNVKPGSQGGFQRGDSTAPS